MPVKPTLFNARDAGHEASCGSIARNLGFTPTTPMALGYRSIKSLSVPPPLMKLQRCRIKEYLKLDDNGKKTGRSYTQFCNRGTVMSDTQKRFEDFTFERHRPWKWWQFLSILMVVVAVVFMFSYYLHGTV